MMYLMDEITFGRRSGESMLISAEEIVSMKAGRLSMKWPNGISNLLKSQVCSGLMRSSGKMRL